MDRPNCPMMGYLNGYFLWPGGGGFLTQNFPKIKCPGGGTTARGSLIAHTNKCFFQIEVLISNFCSEFQAVRIQKKILIIYNVEININVLLT